MIRFIVKIATVAVLVFIALVVLAIYNPFTIIQLLNQFLYTSYIVLAAIGECVLKVALIIRGAFNV